MSAAVLILRARVLRPVEFSWPVIPSGAILPLEIMAKPVYVVISFEGLLALGFGKPTGMLVDGGLNFMFSQVEFLRPHDNMLILYA